MANLQRTALGKTGFTVSSLGYGAAPVAYLNTERDAAVANLNHLLDEGLNLIDTASSYPGSHAFLGDNFSHRRKDFVLVSKCGGKIPEIDGVMWSPEYIAAQIDLALKLLKTDAIDVMLLHSCDLKTLQKGEVIPALTKARDAGKIKFAGYSGDNEAAVWAAEQPDVAVIETSVNITDQKNIDGALAVAAARSVGVLAKRPVANACWKDLSEQRGIYKNYAKSYTDRLAQMKLTPADLGGLEWAEVALRFTLSQPAVNTALVGTTNPTNVANNLKYAEKGPLPREVVAKIRAAFKAADPDGKWAGLT
jgi:aryl-alcohol dehydrogenase-like predicted oxidoreductase